MMAKALITGGSGFLGSALARHLRKEGVEVVLFDKSKDPQPDQRHGSVTDLRQVEGAVAGVDVVFHLAGLLGTSELLGQNAEAVEVNIKGTVLVLEACVRQGVKRVFYPTKPNEWLNTYSITKEAGEKFAQMYARLRGLDVRILRWLNAYGPGQKAYPVRKAVPTMILQALQNQDIEIYGTGEQPVDLIYADDLARTTVLYTLREGFNDEVRDTGNTVRMSVNELADLIRKLTGSTRGVRHLPMRPGEDPDKPVRPLPGPTAADLIWTSGVTTPVEAGLAATIEDYARIRVATRERLLAFHKDATGRGEAGRLGSASVEIL